VKYKEKLDNFLTIFATKRHKRISHENTKTLRNQTRINTDLHRFFKATEVAEGTERQTIRDSNHGWTRIWCIFLDFSTKKVYNRSGLWREPKH